MLFPICAFLQKTSKIEGSAALFGAFLKVFLPPDFAPEIEDFSAYKQRENEEKNGCKTRKNQKKIR